MCVVLDINRELCFDSAHDNRHRDVNLQWLSWVPCAEVMPKRLRRDIRCLIVACVQTLVSPPSGVLWVGVVDKQLLVGLLFQHDV